MEDAGTEVLYFSVLGNTKKVDNLIVLITVAFLTLKNMSFFT